MGATLLPEILSQSDRVVVKWSDHFVLTRYAALLSTAYLLLFSFVIIA